MNKHDYDEMIKGKKLSITRNVNQSIFILEHTTRDNNLIN